MYLKRIEISGFKSFAQKTVFDFMRSHSGDDLTKIARGITAIVGPNGSGKSNVSDAVRWVMGEQSIKSLRGKKSEDVIFSGSESHARQGSARVDLFFDNVDKRINIDFLEVVVSRKLYRSGEGEYLINGSRVRLCDVVDLLSHAGIGKESYCVVTQGMSDAVLNAEPVERRGILEDAAGVKQYQIKKKRSIQKLLLSKNNLERVSLLLLEIEPHLRILKRQAERAEKRKDVQEKLIALQRQLYGYLWSTFKTNHHQFLEEKRTVGLEMKNAERFVDQLNDDLRTESKKNHDKNAQNILKQQRDELYHTLRLSEKEHSVMEGKVEILKERKKQEELIRYIPVDLPYVQSELHKLQKLQNDFVAIFLDIKDLTNLEEVQQLAKNIQSTIEELFVLVGKGKRVLARDPQSIARSHEHQNNIDLFLERILNEQKHQKNIKKNIADVSQKIADSLAEDERARARFFELEKQMREKQDSLNRIRNRFNDIKVQLVRVEVHEEDLTRIITSELNCVPDDLSYEGTVIDRDDIERKILRLKSERDQIGGIDPLVKEEYDETQKRYDVLKQESEDLEKAIISLKEIIREMDVKIDTEFERAFTGINSAFIHYFQLLFGGGKAKLAKIRIPISKSPVLTGALEGQESNENSEKELTTDLGVEIFASPPGKKITQLSLLSGGERSLTSLALLFAIISHNPPPFVIMDEVEAALDEENSRRFGKILQEFSRNTQFIAITHNRETMRQADLLYGVTMGDNGISKVLSVKLDHVHS